MGNFSSVRSWPIEAVQVAPEFNQAEEIPLRTGPEPEPFLSALLLPLNECKGLPLLEARFGPHGITIDPSSGSVIDGHPLDLVRKADDESVAVGHLHLRQRPRVHHVVLADDLV